MEVIADEAGLRRYVEQALHASERHPLLVDRYLAGRDRSRRRCDLRRRARSSSAASWSTSSTPESIRATAPACCRRARSSAAMQEELMRADADAGARTRRGRSDQCAVRDLRGRDLHPGSQSARLAHDPVRQQGDRRAAGEARRAGDGGQEARGPRLHRGARPAPCLGQGVGVSLRALPRRRHDSRPRDEIDRRSDGNRRHLRDGVRQGRAGGLDRSCRQRAGVHQRARRRQAAARTDCARTCRDGLRAGRDRRHRAAYRSASVSRARP